MTKPFALLASILLTGFSSFGQVETTVQSVAEPVTESIAVPLTIRPSYMGCCTPVVRYQQSSGCCSEVLVQSSKKDEDQLKITDPDLDNVGVSPNPTKGDLQISLPPSLIGYEIRVIDMTGRLVGNATPITGTIENLTIEGESGVYLITIRTEQRVITERVLLDVN